MRRLPPMVLLATLLATCCSGEPVCIRDPKGVELSEVLWRSCMQGHYRDWAAAGDDNATALSEQCGCWKRVRENGNGLWRTLLWQDMETGQCRLDFTGFGGSNSTNPITFVKTLAIPPVPLPVCGFGMWGPFVLDLREHIRMSRNFSDIMELLAGPKSTCKGEIMVTGISMGGSIAEMVAGCANSGKLPELFDTHNMRTNWTVGELYLFAPQASATEPIRNALNPAKGHCFKGKRFYIQGDWMGGSLGALGIRHPHIETVEYFRGKDGPTYRVYPCYDEATTRDDSHEMPPELSKETTSRHHELIDLRKTKLPHDMTFHKEFLRWFHESGILNFSSVDFPYSVHGNSLDPPDSLTNFGKKKKAGRKPKKPEGAEDGAAAPAEQTEPRVQM